MFKKIKKYIIYGVLLLCLVLTPTLITLLYNGDSIDVYERTINVSEIGELSYEEKAKNFLSTLDDVNINKNETKLVIKAKYNKSNIDFTSTGEEPYDAICSSEFRLDSNKFVFTSGKVVDSVEVYDSIDEYDVSIDESTDDVFLTDENGNKINVKEMVD